MASTASFSELLQELPVKSAIVTDQEGVLLLRTGAESGADLALQRMAVTFAQTLEHANKLQIGKNKLATAFYGATPQTPRHPPHRCPHAPHTCALATGRVCGRRAPELRTARAHNAGGQRGERGAAA